MPHALVIGAGPAGSIASIVLARGGWRVTLVEQHRFPRDKVCGECLSALGIDVLKRLALLERLHSVHPIKLSRAILHTGGSSAELPLPGSMLGMSRLVLDQILLEAAREAGAEIQQPARFESLTPGNDVIAQVRCLWSNRINRIHADIVFIADGKSPTAGVRELGIKAHFCDMVGSRDAIELFGVAGYYGGIAPIEGGRWNVAFSIPMWRVRRQPALDRLFAEVVSENWALADRMKGARRCSRWLAAPLQRASLESRWPQKIVAIGNAAAAIEPIGGEGMGLAMRSAELASVMLLNGATAREILRAFPGLWRMRAPAYRAAGVAVSSPRLSRLFVGAARITPLASVALRAVGRH